MAKKKEDTGAEAPDTVLPYKISKVSLTPSRKINLGNYETLECQAGIEIVFDTPVSFDSEQVTDALAQARKMIQGEFREQVIAFGRKKEAQKTA